MTLEATRKRTSDTVLVIVLISAACLIGLYYSLRFGGRTMESDTAQQTVGAHGVVLTGRLEHPRNYNNGYGYAAQLAFVSHVAGLPVQQLQVGASAWIFALVLAAYVAYREFLGRQAVAVLACALLLMQPDFMFYVLRGAHEKTTWLFAFLMLFLLARSFRYAQQPARFVPHVALFYLVFWAMAAANVYFASTFVNAMLISLVAGGLLLLLPGWGGGGTGSGTRRDTLRRLLIIVGACLTVLYLAINYFYRPALHYYRIFADLIDRTGLLVLGAQPAASPASYGHFGKAWRSSAGYLSLTGLQWLIAVTSLVAWALALRRLARADQKSWLLWLLYTAFGGLLGLGLVVDYAGFLNTNLQLRMFTPFALFSSALAAGLIYDCYRKLRGRWRRAFAAAGTVLVGYGLVATALKVTNDPALGNQWLFYSPGEVSADHWARTHLQQDSAVWVDSWHHLAETFLFWEGYRPKPAFSYDFGLGPSAAPYILVSDLTRLRANRFGASLPGTVGHNRVYDSGVAQLYHRRPLTPYQR